MSSSHIFLSILFTFLPWFYYCLLSPEYLISFLPCITWFWNDNKNILMVYIVFTLKLDCALPICEVCMHREIAFLDITALLYLTIWMYQSKLELILFPTFIWQIHKTLYFTGVRRTIYICPCSKKAYSLLSLQQSYKVIWLEAK